jgi:hypothetical protein
VQRDRAADPSRCRHVASKICLLLALSTDLDPGERHVFEYWWDGSGGEGPLASGVYHVVGYVGGPEGAFYSEWVPIRISVAPETT